MNLKPPEKPTRPWAIRRGAIFHSVLLAALTLLIALSSVLPGLARDARAHWQEPVAGFESRILSDYQAPSYPWGSGHRGVDVLVDDGEVIISPTAGFVHFAGRVVTRGVISIIDEHGLIASFEPVCPLATTGQGVLAGEPIATHCGADESYGQHCATECIHFSARLDGAYLSPLHLIYGLKPSRLWPVPEL